MLSLLGAVSFPSALKIPVVTPPSCASTPKEQAVGVYRSAGYQEHMVQIRKLAKREELAEKFTNLPRKSHSRIPFFLSHSDGKEITFGTAHLVFGFFFSLLHS